MSCVRWAQLSGYTTRCDVITVHRAYRLPSRDAAGHQGCCVSLDVRTSDQMKQSGRFGNAFPGQWCCRMFLQVPVLKFFELPTIKIISVKRKKQCKELYLRGEADFIYYHFMGVFFGFFFFSFGSVVFKISVYKGTYLQRNLSGTLQLGEI